jgi:small subunit ribosomal protein S4
MEKKISKARKGSDNKVSADHSKEQSSKQFRKLSEYGKQLEEKQKLKNMYGMREKQFRRFFSIALKSREATGQTLLSLLERRLDNVLFRLKLAPTRLAARKIIVHGHILVDGVKVYSPSFLVDINNVISLASNVESKKEFLEQVIEKRLNTNIKVPDWIELDKKNKVGKILRLPVRSDLPSSIEEHLIVELYSK